MLRWYWDLLLNILHTVLKHLIACYPWYCSNMLKASFPDILLNLIDPPGRIKTCIKIRNHRTSCPHAFPALRWPRHQRTATSPGDFELVIDGAPQTHSIASSRKFKRDCQGRSGLILHFWLGGCATSQTIHQLCTHATSILQEYILNFSASWCQSPNPIATYCYPSLRF